MLILMPYCTRAQGCCLLRLHGLSFKLKLPGDQHITASKLTGDNSHDGLAWVEAAAQLPKNEPQNQEALADAGRDDHCLVRHFFHFKLRKAVSLEFCVQRCLPPIAWQPRLWFGQLKRQKRRRLLLTWLYHHRLFFRRRKPRRRARPAPRRLLWRVYCRAPHRRMPPHLHCRRRTPLRLLQRKKLRHPRQRPCSAHSGDWKSPCYASTPIVAGPPHHRFRSPCWRSRAGRPAEGTRRWIKLWGLYG